MTFWSLDELAPDPHLALLLSRLNAIEPADRDPRNYHSCLALLLAREKLSLEEQEPEVLIDLSLARSDLFEDVLTRGDVEKVFTAFGHGHTGALFAYTAARFEEGFKARKLHLRGKVVVSPRERKERWGNWLASTEQARKALLQEFLSLSLEAGGEAVPLEWLWDLVEARRL